MKYLPNNNKHIAHQHNHALALYLKIIILFKNSERKVHLILYFLFLNQSIRQKTLNNVIPKLDKIEILFKSFA